MDHGAWADEFPGAITVCDRRGIIVEMNEQAARSYGAQGGLALIGTNVLDCHPPRARQKLERLMETRQPNVYTTERSGVRKLIYQAPWTVDGEYAGLVELALVLPAEMPHFRREG